MSNSRSALWRCTLKVNENTPAVVMGEDFAMENVCFVMQITPFQQLFQ